MSREQRDRAHATWALGLLCMQPRDPINDTFTLHHAWRLMSWHRAEVSQRELAGEWGFPSLYACRKAMEFTQVVLAGRLDARGLLA